MTKKTKAPQKGLTPGEWERSWQQHWKKAKLNYEFHSSQKKSAQAE